MNMDELLNIFEQREQIALDQIAHLGAVLLGNILFAQNFPVKVIWSVLTFILLKLHFFCFLKHCRPDQLASLEAS